jgi:hypothetical protein
MEATLTFSQNIFTFDIVLEFLLSLVDEEELILSNIVIFISLLYAKPFS